MAKVVKKVLPKKKPAKGQKRIKPAYPFTIIVTVAALLLSLFVLVNALQQNQDQRTRAQTTNCEVPTSEMAIDTEEQKMVDLLNAYRQQKGVPPLKISPSLTRMAAWLSKDMAAKNYLEHKDSLGREPEQRGEACVADYWAENIAMGNADAEGTMEQWKSSPGHDENMLDPKYTMIGIARSGEYWTQDFGQTDDSSTPQPSTDPIVGTPTTVPTMPAGSPTNVVPNPGCIGSCPTIAPIIDPNKPNPLDPEPTAIQNPDISGEPEDPTDPEPTDITETPFPSIPTNPGTGGSNQGGIIELFLAFLKLIIEFFTSLFR